MKVNREIKFRAWDKLNNKMLYPIDIFNSQDLWWADDENGNIRLERILDSYGSREILEIQQYTGFKDKNNKEIYEGDLVKINPEHITNTLKYKDNPIYTCGEIMYLSGSFKVCQSGLGATYLNDFISCQCCDCGLEIIGNICENPGLIKD